MPVDSPNQPLRVLLITSVSEPGFYYSPSIGLHRLKYHLETCGFPCDILDLMVDDREQFYKKVDDGNYDVIGYSVSHRNMLADLDVLWRLKAGTNKLNRPILYVGGGQEATLNYDQWLDAGLDIILTGFAERRLQELCERFAKCPEMPFAMLCGDLDGSIVRDGSGKTRVLPSASLTHEEFRQYSYTNTLHLEMPYPKYWEKIAKEIPNTNFNKNKFVVENVRLFTSSHCPRGCGFCSSQTFLPVSQDKRSAIIMISAEELHEVILRFVNDYGAKSFLFSDDDFLIGNKVGLERNMKLMKLLIASKEKGELPEDIKFNCQTRVACFMSKSNGETRIRWDLLDLMAKSGFHSIGMGVETFSDRLLQVPSINKVGITSEDCCLVIEALLSKGILPQINLIIGIPEATVDELFQSMMIGADYMLKGCQVAVTALLEAIPGAPLLNETGYKIISDRWVNPETNKKLDIVNYVVPNDPELASIIHKLESESAKELAKIKAKSPWQQNSVPRFLTGLAFFITFSKLLNRPDMVQYFEKILTQLLDRVESLANV